jgi:Putative beta-barrel porin-2, OmpL-like. bbp2
VQDLYASEPHIGAVSGPSVEEFVQEATTGYKLGSTLWIDGGIFAAHTGYEGWISRDNLTYTRSIVADYSAYYEAGVKLTWTPSQAVTTQFLVINGWQDIFQLQHTACGRRSHRLRRVAGAHGVVRQLPGDRFP